MTVNPKMERQMSMLETQAPISASKLMEDEELSGYDVERLMYGFGLVKYLVSTKVVYRAEHVCEFYNIC